MASRSVLATVLLLTVAACGEPTPRFQQKTSAEWAASLWDADPQKVTSAIGALVELTARDEAGVLAALETELRRTPPEPDAAPFTVLYDVLGAQRLGLPMPAQGDANAANFPILDRRIAAFGFAPVSIESSRRYEVDVVGLRPHPRKDVERMQAALVRRGAFALHVVAPDPTAPRPPHALRGAVYDDPMPWAERRADELARFTAARKADGPYVPATRRWRIAPRADRPLGDAETYLLLEEPATDDDVVDERIVAKAAAAVAEDGVRLGLAVRPERKEAVKRFCARNAGLTAAVVLDGEIVATTPVPAFDGSILRVPVGPAPKGADPVAWGNDLGLVLASGRMPLPFSALPIPERYGADPSPDNGFSRVLALLGPKAKGLLDRVAAGSFPAWAKASAAWARDHAVDAPP
ncbi:MAG: hypothetical protein U1E39_09360 [Planctomycetota bacterium]